MTCPGASSASPASRLPATLWEACVSAAGLLADIGAREAPGDELGPERELVTVVLAAAVHEQLLRRGLDDDGDVDAVRLVWLPGHDGLVGTLQCAGYATLAAAPAVDGLGAAERAELLDAGLAAHPDRLHRWELVRTAAVQAVERAEREVPMPEHGPVRLADVLAVEVRRRQLHQLQHVLGDEAIEG